MKRLLRIIAICLICAIVPLSFSCANPGNGSGEEKGLVLKKYGNDSYYTVIRYYEEDGVDNLTISAQTVKSVTGDDDAVVGKIKAGAFDGNASLKSVVVKSDVSGTTDLTIEEGAFKNMKSLESITLPFVGKNKSGDAFLFQTESAVDKAVDKERTIGWVFGEDQADYTAAVSLNYGTGSATFYIPVPLTKITVENDSEEGINIPMYAFCGLNQVYEINLKGNIKAIGEAAFKDMKHLIKINIPDTVTDIYSSAFEGTDSLKNFNANGFSFGDNPSLVEIWDSAFKGTCLTAFTLPATVTRIGESCFAQSSLTSFEVSSPSELAAVGSYAFYGSDKLQISSDAFPAGCTFGVWWNEGTKA